MLRRFRSKAQISILDTFLNNTNMGDKECKIPMGILEPFLPEVPGLDWFPVGSRTYMPAPKSDFDIMFNPYDREHVLNHLRDKKVCFKEGAEGSVRFTVRVDVGSLVLGDADINFCFVKDFRAWKEATELMVCLSKGFPNNPFVNLSKKQRLSIFADIVEKFGGKRPPMHLRSF